MEKWFFSSHEPVGLLLLGPLTERASKISSEFSGGKKLPSVVLSQ